MKAWSDSVLVMHCEMTEKGATYVLAIKTSPSTDGRVLTIAEQYHEPGMEPIRDWVFEKQESLN